jgi:NAD(P)-dependent dehydrogenase (short-subunit alcohol dehydrogenase family)
MKLLENKTAIITGGGTGIGFTIAERYFAEGAAVVITGRRENVLEDAAAKIGAGSDRVMFVRGDISDENDVRRTVEETFNRFGRVDVLVNNAGYMRINKPPEETSLEEWNAVINTNVNGTFLCSREAGKVMIQQKSGTIINISSMSSFVINKYFHGGSYEVSKAAINMLTKALATEWARYNISVNAIAPGYYGTTPNLQFFDKSPGLHNDILDLIPQKKLGDLNELANLALFLASDQVKYLSGVTIPIDGGYTIW